MFVQLFGLKRKKKKSKKNYELPNFSFRIIAVV